MPRPRAALLLLLCSTITTALRPTRRRDLFAVTAATYWNWGFAATGVLHATHAATALDADLPPRKSKRPMITVTPLVHRGKLPRPKALGGRGSTYDMEPGIIGSHLPWPTDARLPGAS